MDLSCLIDQLVAIEKSLYKSGIETFDIARIDIDINDTVSVITRTPDMVRALQNMKGGPKNVHKQIRNQ